ncbi:thiol:disulfide interchange protein DsbG [Acidihalobacter aeolianus]|nr:thiol:disulfide interchange protein DsbG [Acidihalobacter aeolianus]
MTLGLSLAGGAAMAAEHAAPEAAPAITQTIPGMANLKVEKKIALKQYGLTAYIVKTPQGRSSVFYTDASGKKFMILGLLIGPGGHNETAKLLLANNTPINYSKLAAAVATRKVIHDGTKGPLIYAFFDPNCIFCHKLWAATRTDVETGKLQIDWLPVAFLKQSSQGKAVAIMSSKDPLNAMNDNEINFNSSEEEGGITPADMAEPTTAMKQAAHQIAENEATMREYHFNGTPTIVFKGKKDGKWHAFGGMPPGGASTIVALAG